jgi:cobalt-zinc-cadmium efflux system outer membrane protein
LPVLGRAYALVALVAAAAPLGAASDQPPPDASKQRPHVLTLALAIQEGLAFDPRMSAQAETVRQAEADVRTASLWPNPSLSVSGTLIPLNGSFTAETQGGPSQLDVELSFPLGWAVFGKRGAAVASANAGLDQTRAAYDDFVRQRRSEVASAFVDVLEARRLLELAGQETADLDRVQAIAQQRAAVGGAAPVEVDRTAVAVLESRRERRRREATLAVARATLAADVGRTGADADFELDGDLAVRSPMPPPALDSLVAKAEQGRPDIIARRRAVARTSAELRLAQKGAWPELTSRVGLTRQYQEPLGFPDASSWGVGLDVEVPIFDRNQGGIARATSAQAQSEFELRAALLALRAEVQQAAADYSVAREAVLAEDPAQLEAAERVRDRIRKAYEIGGRPLLEVLDAERVYREAAREVASGSAAFWRAVHRLNAAVGQEVVP